MRSTPKAQEVEDNMVMAEHKPLWWLRRMWQVRRQQGIDYAPTRPTMDIGTLRYRKDNNRSRVAKEIMRHHVADTTNATNGRSIFS